MQKESFSQTLSRHILLKNLTPAEVKVLDSAAVILQFPPGECIYPSSATVGGLCFLLKGKAYVYSCLPFGEQKGSFLRSMSSGAVFGVQSVYAVPEGIPPPSHIFAEKECSVVMIPAACFESFLAENPPLTISYIQFLTGRTRYLNEKIGYLTAGSAEQKLVRYLLLLASDTGCNPALPFSLVLPCSMQELAALLDLGRASLYRALDALMAEGFLCREGNTLHIPNPATLAVRYL